jgi:hypothetical protein
VRAPADFDDQDQRVEITKITENTHDWFGLDA